MIDMIFKTKERILGWLSKHDSQYTENVENNSYEFIDIHDEINQSLLNELIKKDHLSSNYFENLRTEGHQYIVSVKGDVDISLSELKKIPIQFYQIEKRFWCWGNQLESLKGCPHIVGESFYCYNNQLTSLEYCPQFVGKSFDCSFNKIFSLKQCSQYIGLDFNCSNNQLTSLEFCNQSILGDLDCSINQLSLLKYCPQVISGNFWCDDNPLKSLEYFPHQIGKFLSFLNNQELLKYKHESTNINIQNMSDDDFLNQRYFKFWQQFHLQEKSKKENTQIIDNLSLDEKNNKHLTQPKIKKM